MIDEVVERLKVVGSSKLMAAVDPKPGKHTYECPDEHADKTRQEVHGL